MYEKYDVECVNMSQAKLDRIQEINVRIMQLDNKRIAGGISLSDINGIAEEIKMLEDEREVLEKAQLAEEQAEREQGKQEVFTSYMDTLTEMFEAFLPSETFRPLFGINDYEEKRAQFYQLNQAYTGEAIDTQHRQFEEIIAAKDERIKALKEQSLVFQQDLDQANSAVEQCNFANEQMLEELNVMEKSFNESQDVVGKLREQHNQLETRYNNLWNTHQANCDTINDLTTKLEAAQQPKEEAKTSVKVTDLISQIKSKNDIAPDDFIARWNARQKDDAAKLDLPEAPQQESPHSETAEIDAGSNQVLDAESTVEAPTFQTIQAPPLGLPMATIAPESDREGNETIATQGWVNARLAEQKKDILAEIRGEKVAS